MPLDMSMAAPVMEKLPVPVPMMETSLPRVSVSAFRLPVPVTENRVPSAKLTSAAFKADCSPMCSVPPLTVKEVRVFSAFQSEDR